MIDPDIQYIQISISICIVAYFGLLWVLRKDSVSLGLPFAYLSLLLLNHVPGAYVQLADDMFYGHRHETAIGIRLTAIGVVCFVIGVWLARRNTAEARANPGPPTSASWFEDDKPFWMFCFLGGMFFSFGLTPLRDLPSIGAVVYNGGVIWMLGVLLGLRAAVRNHDRKWIAIWTSLLIIYPTLILLTIGFLSYGTAAVIIVISALAISARNYWRVVITVVLAIYLGLSIFSNYFQARDNIRDAVWGGVSTEKRLDAISKVFTEFKFFDGTDQFVLVGFDLRLNQNYFIGLAAENIDSGAVHYLYGRSVSEALLALVPRVVWQKKTVFGGSPDIVRDMTGLDLAPTASWGVGQVMEFYINFGIPGLIAGFLGLGWLLGRFDHRAALAEARDDYGTTMLFFLPGVAFDSAPGINGGTERRCGDGLDRGAFLEMGLGASGYSGSTPAGSRAGPAGAVKVFIAATSLSPNYGGPAVSVSRLALALCHAGAEVGLWSQDGSALTTELLPSQLPDRLTRLSGSASGALDSYSPDILHDNGLWLPHNRRLAALAAHRNLARVVSTRGMLEPWARSHKKWKKDLAWVLYQHRDLKRAQAIHATAASEAGNIARLNLGVPLHTIPNGVDIPVLPVPRHAGTDESPRTALFLGRLYPIKGLPNLIKAWDRVRPEGWRLVLAGPDEAGHGAELEALVRNAELNGTISFAGPLAGPDKFACLAGADLFILPSYSESFGIAIAEALAHGLPVLTTSGTPWPMLGERDCGWTVEATIDGIAEGLRRATSQGSKRLKAMGAKGRAFVEAEFGWESVANQFIATYEDVLVNHGNSRNDN